MIPLVRPTLPDYGKMEKDIRNMLDSGMLTDDQNVRAFEEKARAYLGVKHTIAASSGTTGLMAIMSTVPAGSDVIMPAYTFSATYQALLWNNLNPVFVDCDDVCNIDVDKVEAAITTNTKAIVAVHLFGNACDIEKLQRIADKHNLSLFFDAAHGFGSEHKGKKIGNFGLAEVFSLSPTKALAVGEGSIISTNNTEFYEKIKLICRQGQRRVGTVDSAVKALNARMQEFSGILGVHMLDMLDELMENREKLALHYVKNLTGIQGITLCLAHPENKSTYKDFTIFVDKKKFGVDRDELHDMLTKQEIQTRKYYYPPIHRLELCKERFKNVHLPKTELLSETTLSLPFYSHMTLADIDTVCAAIKKIHAQHART